MLNPDRHRPVIDTPWNAHAVRAAIEEIARDALVACDDENFWPKHPLDDGMEGQVNLYMGAGGMIWALDYLHRHGIEAAAHDFHAVIPSVIKRGSLDRAPPPYSQYGSLLIGDMGIMLAAMRIAPGDELIARIASRIQQNDKIPVTELMWGTPGSMITAIRMHELTGDKEFLALYRKQATRLLKDLEDDEDGLLWTQDLYGQKMRMLGAVHGFAGNIAALLAGWSELTDDQRARVQEATIRTLSKQAVKSTEGIEWPERPKPQSPIFLCQHCHGAPGIVTSIASAPFSTPDFENLLLGGGELIWNAGPLTKGSNLCHGTAGNGYAFLKLYKRTGDKLWLDRARAFAMTAIEQVREARAEHGMGRYSLWTGDIGAAIYLLDCIEAEANFPTIDVI